MIFKYANPTGDGFVRFDEWKALFRNFLSEYNFDVMNPKSLTLEQEIMLKLDEHIHLK